MSTVNVSFTIDESFIGHGVQFALSIDANSGNVPELHALHDCVKPTLLNMGTVNDSNTITYVYDIKKVTKDDCGTYQWTV